MRPDQQVEAARGLVHHRIRRSALGQHGREARAQRLEQGIETRPHHHAGADIDNLGARALMEAHHHAPALAAQHEVGAPPLARRADERRLEAGRVDAALRQRADDQLDFPRGIGIAPPMLQGAAAADLEVGAGRRLAMARRRQHLHQIGGDPLASFVTRFGLDRLARQREGHEVAPSVEFGDPIAACTDLADVEPDAHIVAQPSQLLAGCISPTSKPTTFLTGGWTISSRWSAGRTPRWSSRVAMATSAARPAPSHILRATPNPRLDSMPQNTPSAPPLTCATPGRAALMRVPKLPVPPIMNGSALIAARMRPAASACLFDRRDGSAMLAMARARLLSGVASVGMPQPSVPWGKALASAPQRSLMTSRRRRCTGWSYLI